MPVSLNYYPKGKTKAVTLSYDDGGTDDRKLVQLCNQYGVKGTFHLTSGFFGLGGYFSKEEASHLYKGHEISAHTRTHPHLTRLPKESAIEEIRQDRHQLEGISEYPVIGMSYPFGAYNDDVIRLLKAQGIVYSRTVLSTNSFHLPEDFMKWHPTCHHNQNLLETASRFLEENPYLTMPLLYVWGHSYEFPKDNNWNVMEDFLQLVSGRNEIWFATNIEIYRYIQAQKSLVFSVDCSWVYNPSGISVWIGIDGSVVEVSPNQILKL